MFEKEKNGLEFLKDTKTVTVPEVIWCGEENNKQILLLEWIEQGLPSDKFWKNFGEQLAALHLGSDENGHTAFGFHEDNYMGALPQLNSFKEDWIEFLIQCRLEPQLELAAHNNLIGKKEVEQFHSLYKKLKAIFS